MSQMFADSSSRLPSRLKTALVAAVALGCPVAASAQTIRVGSKNFTEQYVLAELYAQTFEANGIKVERKINLGGTLIAQKALEEKQMKEITKWSADKVKDTYIKVNAEYRDCVFGIDWLKKSTR